jgi:hypothetical protein
MPRRVGVTCNLAYEAPFLFARRMATLLCAGVPRQRCRCRGAAGADAVAGAAAVHPAEDLTIEYCHLLRSKRSKSPNRSFLRLPPSPRPHRNTR